MKLKYWKKVLDKEGLKGRSFFKHAITAITTTGMLLMNL